MIIANLATFPPRKQNLFRVVDRIAPQVDVLNVVLNEYDEVPPELGKHSNVKCILPPENLRDVGKFYPDTKGCDFVFFIDDDILYPENFVKTAITQLKSSQDRNVVGGFHGSIYRKMRTPTSLKKIWAAFSQSKNLIKNRKVFKFSKALEKIVIVDQIGSGTLLMRGEHVPPFEFMQGAQKFVDVRLARWCHEQKIRMLCLPREKDWLQQLPVENSIYQDFTVNTPTAVLREIETFAFKISERKKWH